MYLKNILKVIPFLLLAACSPTKFVPEGSYLLNNVEIHSDTRDISPDDLSEYLRQNSNSYVFGLFRMQLGIYNLAGLDSAKWYNKVFKRVGQAPVIYDPLLTSISANQIKMYCVNKGYMDAQVDQVLKQNKKGVNLKYDLHTGKPWKMESYEVDVTQHDLRNIAMDSVRSIVQNRMNFDIDQLNAERGRITSRMREMGFYNFNKDYLEFIADTAEHTVNVSLGLRDYISQSPDSIIESVFRQYHVSKVVFRIVDPVSAPSTSPTTLDTVYSANYTLISPREKVLTLSSLISNTYVEPYQLYSDKEVERTYSSLNSLGPVKYVNIAFERQGSDSLICNINISQAKTFSVSAQSEATFTEGYWGIAGNLGTINRNLFKGAETLSLQGRVGLEWQDNVLAQEWGAQVGLSIPRMIMPLLNYSFKRQFQGVTEFKSNYNYQFRPGEFTVTNVGSGVNYVWNGKNQTHRLDLVDLSYVYFPKITDAFRDAFITTGKYNSYNYENHLIMRTGYGSSYSTFNENRPLKNFEALRYSFEASGNTLYALSKLMELNKDADGYYKVFNIRYSQYVRAEGSYSFNHIFDKFNRLVYHAGLGVGMPYGNAEAIPFERRFYSGGANSVRGWSESTLGPGTYQRIATQIRDYNQVGDIKLDLNLEYRTKLFWVMEGAAFLDAGNIWTIRDYSYQPGGVFRPESFYKQIALAYGLGLRMDFSFFLFRFDVGKRLYDPARTIDTRWRTNFLSEDFAFHIAIGYPF